MNATHKEHSELLPE